MEIFIKLTYFPHEWESKDWRFWYKSSVDPVKNIRSSDNHIRKAFKAKQWRKKCHLEAIKIHDYKKEEIMKQYIIWKNSLLQQVNNKFQLSPKRSLQATTVVAETTVVADIGGLTVFSAIDVVPCNSTTSASFAPVISIPAFEITEPVQSRLWEDWLGWEEIRHFDIWGAKFHLREHFQNLKSLELDNVWCLVLALNRPIHYLNFDQLFKPRDIIFL